MRAQSLLAAAAATAARRGVSCPCQVARACTATTTLADQHPLAGVVDLNRYPLHDAAAARAAAAAARRRFLATGLVTFPGFMAPAAVARAVAESRPRVPAAFESVQRHNAFLLADADAAFPSGHVRNRQLTTQVASVAFDELPADGVLRRLYSAPELVEFVSAVVLGAGGDADGGSGGNATGNSSGSASAAAAAAGVSGRDASPTAAAAAPPRLHRLDDPLGACSINVFRPGRFHDWHFDESEFTTTLCLQPAAPGAGGDFLYTAPMAARGSVGADGRIVGDPAEAEALFAQVTSIVDAGYDSRHPAVHKMEFPAGTLALFAGNRSLHCVTPVAVGTAAADGGDGGDDGGDDDAAARLVAVLCFAREPGVRNSAEVQRLFWGRVVQ